MKQNEADSPAAMSKETALLNKSAESVLNREANKVVTHAQFAPLLGDVFKIDATATSPSVCPISFQIEPGQQTEALVVFADNLGAGWIDKTKKQLRIQFHVIAVFGHAKVDELYLSLQGVTSVIPLHPTCVDSPGMGQNHPNVEWSGQSRFVLDETVELPDWVGAAKQFDLSVIAGTKKIKLGVIHIGQAIKEQDQKSNQAAASSVETTKPASQIARDSIAIKMKGVIDKVKASSRVPKIDRLLFITVILPTLISTIYFGFVASDIYISESRFVVRSPQRQASAGLGALIQGAGFSRSQDDSYTVSDFIFSRDALKNLNDEFALGKEYASKKVDIFSRFSGLDWDGSFEALHRYYQKKVTVDLDTSSSITTLRVSAFSPDLAYNINEKLLGMSEKLMNQLNERGRQDLISFAETEVALAEQKAKQAELNLSKYRAEKGVFNPEGQSALKLQQIGKIQEDLLASKILMAQIQSISKENPQLPSLKSRIDSLQDQSDTETAKVAGADQSLSAQSVEYEGLALERSFAAKQLASALTSLEQARSDALRKQLYLERIVQPSKPDVALEPRRIRNIIAIFLLGLIAWGILTMLLAGVREHQD